MKLLDLFSGIGGFSLGAESHGIETIGFVEKDPFCQRVLKKNWPNVPIESDIRNVKGENYGATDIISGGFPCQPFSVAGKRKGTDDDRYLWDETIRVVAEVKPRWFIGENVEGLINIQDGMVLRQVQDDLEKEGFQVQCLVIPASGIGAWHQRKRVWIIAYSNSNRESRRSQYVQKRSRELGESHVSNSKGSGCSRGESKRHSKEERQILSDKQKRGETRGETEGHNRRTQDVSNTIGELSDGCSSATRLSESKQEWMDSHSQEYKDKVWSETQRCDQQTRSRGDVSNSNGEGLQGHGVQANMEVEEGQVSSISSPQGQRTW